MIAPKDRDKDEAMRTIYVQENVMTDGNKEKDETKDTEQDVTDDEAD